MLAGDRAAELDGRVESVPRPRAARSPPLVAATRNASARCRRRRGTSARLELVAAADLGIASIASARRSTGTPNPR